MSSARIDSYVLQLRRELHRRFVTADQRTLDEVRGHLEDAISRARAQGADLAAAEARALERFGTPEAVATALAADRTRVLHRCLLAAAIVAGIAIAYVDARPTWDDTGITVGAMTSVALALGLFGPRRPWLWAAAVGVWIPADALVRTPTVATALMFVVLLFPLGGAYLGRGARRLMSAGSAA